MEGDTIDVYRSRGPGQYYVMLNVMLDIGGKFSPKEIGMGPDQLMELVRRLRLFGKIR